VGRRYMTGLQADRREDLEAAMTELFATAGPA
jgi:hypothetical protein